MLYHQPRTTPSTILRAGVARIAGLLAEIHRTGADTAYLDGLNDHAIRDLGIRRVDTRDDRFYR